MEDPWFLVLVGAAALSTVAVLVYVVRRMTSPVSTGPRTSQSRRVAPQTSVPVDQAVRAEIDRLVADGQPIRAIKVLREATGLGLKEAKNQVDAWASDTGSTAGVPTAPDPDPSLATEVRVVRDSQGMVAAVKLVRSRTGWGLSEAKAYVDRLDES